MARCKSCGADIVWITTRSGKPMPCDVGLIPFWAKVKAKEKVVTDSGDVVSCLLDGDPEEITGLGPGRTSRPARMPTGTERGRT